jgi:hypothetical protein
MNEPFKFVCPTCGIPYYLCAGCGKLFHIYADALYCVCESLDDKKGGERASDSSDGSPVLETSKETHKKKKIHKDQKELEGL